MLTIQPLSDAIGISINDKHTDEEYRTVADDVLKNSKYDGSNVLRCWRHEEILDLASALGADSNKLPAEANWPSEWPREEFGWLLQICYDGKGNLIDSQTICISEKLMYDDRNDPPGNW